MERKTHRESWKGEESVKERFTLKEAQMVPFLTGDLTLQDAASQLRNKVAYLTPSEYPTTFIPLSSAGQALSEHPKLPAAHPSEPGKSFWSTHQSAAETRAQARIVSAVK